ncbi:unnamed protein product [Phytophthora fragariaefolia]|uniref:Unnamed protein product n=1 Tax=Phytophthora fragariaefolia TaxID=1490495 RepID=A0A9W6Y5A3_9STRA|nr:unnamed protein product [Phytophthora fragariaefolia]
MGRNAIGDDEAGRPKNERSEESGQLDWKKLGLGFGGESRPVYDTAVRKFEDARRTTLKATAAKTKAPALKVKAERRTDAEDDEHGRAASAAQQNWRNDGLGGSIVQGFSGRWPSRGRGRGSVGGRGFAGGHYGSSDARQQRRRSYNCGGGRKEDGGVAVREDAGEDVAAVSAEGEDDGSGVNRKRDAAPHEPKEKEVPCAAARGQRAESDAGTGIYYRADAETARAGRSTMVSVKEVEVAQNKDATADEDVAVTLRESQYLKQDHRRHREAQAAAEVVLREEKQRREQAAIDTGGEEEPVDEATTAAVTAQPPAKLLAAQTPPELLLLEQQYQQQLPDQLEEKGSLAEMRAERRRVLKIPKQYRAAR